MIKKFGKFRIALGGRSASAGRKRSGGWRLFQTMKRMLAPMVEPEAVARPPRELLKELLAGTKFAL